MEHNISASEYGNVRFTSKNFLQEARRRLADAHARILAEQADAEKQPSNLADAAVHQLSGESWPPVWSCEVENPKTGLLGMQAPAAEQCHGLAVSSAPSVSSATRNHQFSKIFTEAIETVTEVEDIDLPEKPRIPSLPAEIHIQIIKHLVSIAASSSQHCGFCSLFTLSSLCRVNRLYNSVTTPLLYNALPLNLSTLLSPTTHCDPHWHLSSKQLQLEKRVPLVVRTLSANQELAESVTSLHLPRDITTWITCHLDKHFLPDLLSVTPNLHTITGVEHLLDRMFTGEHYCLDGEDPQQHGIFAKAVVEKKSLQKWIWRGGAAGGDVWARVWDSNPAMRRVGFVGMHKNWSELTYLGVFEVRGLTGEGMAKVFEKLPKLRTVSIGALATKRIVSEGTHGDRDLMVAVLNAVPLSVKNVAVEDVEDEEFLVDVGRWARGRVAPEDTAVALENRLESLSLGRVCVTAEGLMCFLESLAIKAKPFCAWKNLFGGNQAGHWTSAVESLMISNKGFEEKFCEEDVVKCLDDEEMECRGLRKVVWDIAAEGCEVKVLEDALRRGWFSDLEEVVVVSGGKHEASFSSESAREVCSDRRIIFENYCAADVEFGA